MIYGFYMTWKQFQSLFILYSFLKDDFLLLSVSLTAGEKIIIANTSFVSYIIYWCLQFKNKYLIINVIKVLQAY